MNAGTFIALFLAGGGAFAAVAGQSTMTLYVGRHFEVRDHEQPVKYVFNGDSRLARVTGLLSTSNLLQRLRVQPGWNLISLAVTATNALSQLSNSVAGSGLAVSAYRWEPGALSWSAVAPDETVPAGTVLWLHASASASLAVMGAYGDFTNRQVGPVGDFLPGAGLEAWELRSAIANLPEVTASTYNAARFQWLSSLPPPIQSRSDFPAYLAPGEAVFARSESLTELPAPESALRIRYYHEDHLGSSSTITDAQGALLEETAFYPFGVPRGSFHPRKTSDPFEFTGKERDRETRLHYFEARYMVGQVARFTTVDAKYIRPDALSAEAQAAFLGAPQRLNLYAYALNNPLKFVDPTGLDNQQPRPKVLVIYTKDMLADAKQRMKIKDKATYDAALKVTYGPEAGENAQIIVRQVNSWKELGTYLKGSSYDTVIINTHAYGNDKSIFMEGKKDDVLDVEGLDRFFKGAKTAPQKVFFYGCNTASSGLASDLSTRMPKTKVTGAATVIKQTVEFGTKDGKITSTTVHENRDYNVTYEGGKKTGDNRTVNVKDLQNAPLPRP